MSIILGNTGRSCVSMNKFDKKKLIGSLCCPILTFLWGSIRSLSDLSWGADFTGKGAFRLTAFIAIIFGGILPVILTLTREIHTERYLKKRLIVIVLVYLVNRINNNITVAVAAFVGYMIVGVGAMMFQILKVQDEDTNGSERAVLMLSDPTVYWTLYWFLLYIINYL